MKDTSSPKPPVPTPSEGRQGPTRRGSWKRNPFTIATAVSLTSLVLSGFLVYWMESSALVFLKDHLESDSSDLKQKHSTEVSRAMRELLSIPRGAGTFQKERQLVEKEMALELRDSGLRYSPVGRFVARVAEKTSGWTYRELPMFDYFDELTNGIKNKDENAKRSSVEEGGPAVYLWRLGDLVRAEGVGSSPSFFATEVALIRLTSAQAEIMGMETLFQGMNVQDFEPIMGITFSQAKENWKRAFQRRSPELLVMALMTQYFAYRSANSWVEPSMVEKDESGENVFFRLRFDRIYSTPVSINGEKKVGWRYSYNCGAIKADSDVLLFMSSIIEPDKNPQAESWVNGWISALRAVK